jgi:hypothetical protein
MNKVSGAFAFVLVASLGLGCNDSGLKTQGPGKGGQGGSTASGGVPGSGGSGTGGVATGGAGGLGGSYQSSGGSMAGGTIGTGGGANYGGGGSSHAGGSASGGRGGSNAGGSASGGTSGTGGTICPPIACPGFVCPGGFAPNPDPCGCPICPIRDAGSGTDTPPDAECIAMPCALPLCQPGYVIVTPTCGCPACVPMDAGQPDAIICPPIACPAIGCVGGTVPNPEPCACPICAPADAAVETSKPACVGLDECACHATSGCRAIAGPPCYCPPPECTPTVLCACGGGKFIGCAPANLATCADAKARVAGLCPSLNGPTFDSLCDQSDSACITECLNEVTSCSDVYCTFCEACDCATDPFMSCRGKCNSSLAAK